jgi:hypothetical protein
MRAVTLRSLSFWQRRLGGTRITGSGPSFMYSVLGTVLSLCVFAGVWVLGYMAFTLFDQLRGLGHSRFQMLFRELFVPGVAGYLGNSIAAAWLPKSKVKFVFYHSHQYC